MVKQKSKLLNLEKRMEMYNNIPDMNYDILFDKNAFWLVFTCS